MVRSFDRNRFLASCWLIEEPPCTTPPARALVEHGAEQARNVDAEMLVEAPVLGGERRLDQVVGELVEPQRVVVLDAARADLVAVAVEEGDGELGLLHPVVVRGLAEGRDRERQHHDQAAGAEREPLRDRLDEVPAPPAGDVEPVHEDGEALVKLAPPGLGLVEAEIDARIEIEQETAQPHPPVRSAPWRRSRARGLGRNRLGGASAPSRCRSSMRIF